MKEFFRNKPVTLLITCGLIVILIVLTGVFQFTNPGMSRVGPPGVDFDPGQIPDRANMPEGFNQPDSGQRPEGGNPPAGNGDFQPGEMPVDGKGFQRNNFGGSETTMKLLQLLRGIQTAASILIMALGLLSLIGMLMSKKWGFSWAIVTSILAILAALPDLLQRMGGTTLIATLSKLVLAIAVLVLCFITKPKQDNIPA